MDIKAILNHIKTVCIHKYWVFHYCKKAGIIWQGIIHDLSKFSPTEFYESVKYYTGIGSPIDECKKSNGYSLAWLHHRGRNKHHYEYWTDDYDSGTKSLNMPFKYQLEMLCDYLGAGKAYQGKDFSIKGELDWWDIKRKLANSMNIKTKMFIDIALNAMVFNENVLNYKYMHNIYCLINNMNESDIESYFNMRLYQKYIFFYQLVSNK